MEFIVKDYLGDGVYGMFDGYSIWLHANDHANPTDRICLNPEVLLALDRFEKRCAAVMAEHAAQHTQEKTHSQTDKLPADIKEKFRRFVEEQVSLPSSFADVLNKHFWDLI